MAAPREPVPKGGTDNDLFEPTVNPQTLSRVRLLLPGETFNRLLLLPLRNDDIASPVVSQDEKRRASMRRRRTNTAGEEKWFLAPTSHMNAFQVPRSTPPGHVYWAGFFFANRTAAADQTAWPVQLINAALDISALFEARKDVISRATRFTSKASLNKILDAVEETITAKLGGTVKRRGDSTRCARPPACRSTPEQLFACSLRLARLHHGSPCI